MPQPEFDFRTVFLSDVHLGAAGCKTDFVQHFLHSVRCENLYLVGDIVDGWVGTREGKWQQEHTNVVRTLLGMSKRGTKVFYTPGNHDAFMRRLNGSEFGNIEVDASFVHTTADGCELLVVHGDAFDSTCTKHPRMAWAGAWLYEWVVMLNISVNRRRTARSRRPIDFCTILKTTVKKLVRRVSSYETVVLEHAVELGYDGVVVGHIHRPTIERHGDWLYVNCGDWVENCTAVVEHFDGRLELIRWREHYLETPAAGEELDPARAR